MSDNSALRSRLFRHLDGLATAHVAITLLQREILEEIVSSDRITLEQLCQKSGANDGYLNIALRTLASQGLLEFATDNHSDEVEYRANELTGVLISQASHYQPVVEFGRRFADCGLDIYSDSLQEEFAALLERLGKGWIDAPANDPVTEEFQQRIRNHVEGCLLAPVLVRLGMDGVFTDAVTQNGLDPDGLPYGKSLRTILDTLVGLGWAEPDGSAYRFTETGRFFTSRASAYGVIVSYLPTFSRLDDMIFGDPNTLKDHSPDTDEEHVDRTMNIWGSGGAHANYFRVVDDIVRELFDRPIEEQPEGILDMGCGNGAFLGHLYRLVTENTRRGQMLDTHPLKLIGVDYNRAALDVTSKNLSDWGVPADVIWGDIGQPDRLAADLLADQGLQLGDLLNVRTFLDHNRIWEPPPPKHYRRASSSTGAFAHRGNRVSNNELEVNLYHHLKDWSPYVQRFGLLIIELHTIPPDLAAKNLGFHAATAYDAAHGFSDQYIVEIDVLHRIAKDAGLVSDPDLFRRFPDKDTATVSISLLRGVTSASEKREPRARNTAATFA